ncbi:zinc ribbon domain-containing protein [Leeia sp. TBRC 13508]|uniref:Zinc ribbon domain-containing protein n=1 Tax=Leeia speluncae TaxID=2884804 RepID=A0ABS8DAQ1_9NEIS|nr:FmdB family zinc ribbon protein [Leeia speluncae]MCB6185288.1 zinc ribbon domain-containing protein [Leeia speluncae]
MPIYAYRCSSCGFAKDVLQKISDAPLTDCPECKQPCFSKQLTAAGFQLKGSGWYVTDFRGGSSSSATVNATSPKPAESTTTETTSTTTASAPACGTSGGCGCH